MEERTKILDALKTIQSICAKHYRIDCESCPFYKGDGCFIADSETMSLDWILNGTEAIWRAFN